MLLTLIMCPKPKNDRLIVSNLYDTIITKINLKTIDIIYNTYNIHTIHFLFYFLIYLSIHLNTNKNVRLFYIHMYINIHTYIMHIHYILCMYVRITIL